MAAALSIDLGLWEFLAATCCSDRILSSSRASVATNFYQWMTSRLRVPQRPNLDFTGQVSDIWYVFVAMALSVYVGCDRLRFLQYIIIPVQAFLSWMTVRWIASNFSSNGQRLPIAFDGSPLTYVGWYLLLFISAITIVGWAWVTTAWIRWICRMSAARPRDRLQRHRPGGAVADAGVFAVAAAFLIPIPWVMRWYTRWYVSQFALVERAA